MSTKSSKKLANTNAFNPEVSAFIASQATAIVKSEDIWPAAFIQCVKWATPNGDVPPVMTLTNKAPKPAAGTKVSGKATKVGKAAIVDDVSLFVDALRDQVNEEGKAKDVSMTDKTAKSRKSLLRSAVGLGALENINGIDLLADARLERNALADDDKKNLIDCYYSIAVEQIKSPEKALDKTKIKSLVEKKKAAEKSLGQVWTDMAKKLVELSKNDTLPGHQTRGKLALLFQSEAKKLVSAEEAKHKMDEAETAKETYAALTDDDSGAAVLATLVGRPKRTAKATNGKTA